MFVAGDAGLRRVTDRLGHRGGRAAAASVDAWWGGRARPLDATAAALGCRRQQGLRRSCSGILGRLSCP